MFCNTLHARCTVLLVPWTINWFIVLLVHPSLNLNYPYKAHCVLWWDVRITLFLTSVRRYCGLYMLKLEGEKMTGRAAIGGNNDSDTGTTINNNFLILYFIALHVLTKHNLLKYFPLAYRSRYHSKHNHHHPDPPKAKNTSQKWLNRPMIDGEDIPIEICTITSTTSTSTTTFTTTTTIYLSANWTAVVSIALYWTLPALGTRLLGVVGSVVLKSEGCSVVL